MKKILICLFLFSNLFADERAPEGRCYLSAGFIDDKSMIKDFVNNLGYSPDVYEIFERSDKKLYFTFGKIDEKLFKSLKSQDSIPSSFFCASGKGYLKRFSLDSNLTLIKGNKKFLDSQNDVKIALSPFPSSGNNSNPDANDVIETKVLSTANLSKSPTTKNDEEPKQKSKESELVSEKVLEECGPKSEIWNDCFKSVKWKDGSRYEGEWKDSKLHGQGIYTYKNGGRYEGEFKDGKRHGQGIYTFRDYYRYEGEYKDDKRHGMGIFTISLDRLDGERYEGEWKDDKKHGQGRGIANFRGGTYEGEFKDGLRHGIGEVNYWSGERYVGEFKDGKRNGKGIWTYANGERYEGEFKHKFHGQGIYTYKNGDKYDGEWKDGTRQGQGIWTFSNGDRYEGEFKDGKFPVQGIYTHKNGDKYEGEFKDGKKHGQGIYTYKNGDKYDGEWAKDKKHGIGKQISSSGISKDVLHSMGESNFITMMCWLDSTVVEFYDIRLTSSSVVHYAYVAIYGPDMFYKNTRRIPAITYKIDFIDDWKVHFDSGQQIDLKTKTLNKEEYSRQCTAITGAPNPRFPDIFKG